MRTRRLRIATALAALAIATSSLVARQAAPLPDSLSWEEKEAFLLNAEIANLRQIGRGVTNSQRATLTDGRITHDAHVQTIDVSKLEFRGSRGVELNFRDFYGFNVAAYRLARLLGLDNVPPSVVRRVRGTPASLTWWVNDVLMEEGERRRKGAVGPNAQRTAMQIHVMRVFDELIYNTDRNAGNLLWTTDWKMWMIDHTRAFRFNRTLLSPKLLERCERGLFERLQALTLEDLTTAIGDIVRKDQIQALLARRDLIVKLIEEMVATRGEAAVLYVLDPS